MAKTILRGKEVDTVGELPKAGTVVPDFVLVNGELQEVSLSNFSGAKVLNIFPSLDTPTCALSVIRFNKLASENEMTILNISKDLPFAQNRFCITEGIDKVFMLSAYRSSFGKDYGVELTNCPIQELFARAVIVVDSDNRVLYEELVADISDEPDYDAALAVARER